MDQNRSFALVIQLLDVQTCGPQRIQGCGSNHLSFQLPCVAVMGSLGLLCSHHLVFLLIRVTRRVQLLPETQPF